MAKHSRSFFSDSSSDGETPVSTPKRSITIDNVDLSNVQKLGDIEEGEEWLEIVIEFISMTQNRVGKSEATVSALISGRLLLSAVGCSR